MIVDGKYLYFVVFLTSFFLDPQEVSTLALVLIKGWMFQKLFNFFTGCTFKSKLICTL